ncbi:MAG: hypothetical protein IJ873_08085 [Lachnospiraceae bacterium]|nr:hypothetical protein [Lachnospiraceae bacterium]
MRFFIIGGLTVLAAVLLILDKKGMFQKAGGPGQKQSTIGTEVTGQIRTERFRVLIIGGYLAGVILFSAFYNVYFTKEIIASYQPTSQTFYQKEFAETGEFPDSLLPFLLKDKTVYMKNDPMDIDDAQDMGKDWLYSYYHALNSAAYVPFVGGEAVPDESMNDTMLTDAQIEGDFERLGMANDMYRYSFICTPQFDETGSYFYYYWYYYEHLPEIYAYINRSKDSAGEDIATSKELVLLWDSPMGDAELEDVYLMTKRYYEENVRLAGMDR